MPAAAGPGCLEGLERIGIVRVRVEASVRGSHPPDPGNRGDATGRSARSGDATADFRAGRRLVDCRVGGIEQLRHIRLRRGRAQPATLVRLVPDEPQLDPGIALRGRGGERRKGRARRRRPARSAAEVCPARSAVERHDGRDPVVAQARQNRVRAPPGPLPADLLDLVPVDRETHEVDADPVELGDPLVERSRPVHEPRVVLQPVTDVGRGLGRGGVREKRRDRHREKKQATHVSTVAATP